MLFGASENCSSGDSISDSSERLLLKGREGKVSIYVSLVKGEYVQLRTFFFSRRFLLVTRSRCPHEGF